MPRYNITEPETGEVVGYIDATLDAGGQEWPVSQAQIVAFNAKCDALAKLIGLSKEDWRQRGKDAATEHFGLDLAESTKDWTWEQMHWALDWLEGQIAAQAITAE